jgi:hypothetical protein
MEPYVHYLKSLGIYSYYISCSYKFMKAFLMLD